MKIRIIGSSVGERIPVQFAMSYIINDVLAIDAGCLGFVAPVEAQLQIQSIFLSHSHIDHIGSLPTFLDNVYVPGPECVTVYGSASVLKCLAEDIFNDRVWPDLIRLSEAETPFLKLQALTSDVPVQVGALRLTPIDLNHVVPTHGFVVDDGESAVAFVSDTAPSDKIWSVLNATPNLKAVFLEASFPDSMAWLATKSMHLTPATVQTELRKLNRPVPVLAVHLKPMFVETIRQELQALGNPHLQVARPDIDYQF